MFIENFKLTQPALPSESVISKILSAAPWCDLPAGVYNNGLISLCGTDKFDYETLSDWERLVGEKNLPLLYTAWGEFLCISFSHKTFYWLFPQENGVTDIGNSPTSILDNLLVDSKLTQSLLDLDRYKHLAPELPSLDYGNCYILKPYQILGGDPELAGNYSVGHVEIYLSLVAQTHEQIGY